MTRNFLLLTFIYDPASGGLMQKIKEGQPCQILFFGDQ